MNVVLIAGLSALAITFAGCSSKSGQVSTATLTPTTSSAGPEGSADTPQTITRADNGTALHLAPGDRFLLQLGEDFDWTVSITDESVISRVVGIPVVRGAQGVYQARAAGTTTLIAVGDPPCRKAQPPCQIPSIRFAVDVVVSRALSTKIAADFTCGSGRKTEIFPTFGPRFSRT